MMSRTELAQMIASTRESVTKALMVSPGGDDPYAEKQDQTFR